MVLQLEAVIFVYISIYSIALCCGEILESIPSKVVQ